MYFVYVLLSKVYKKTYVGIRLNQHNKGYHFYTKRYTPWTLIHVEEYSDRIEARKREQYLKSSAGRRWVKRELFNKPRW